MANNFNQLKKDYLSSAIIGARFAIAKRLNMNTQLINTGDKRYFKHVFEREAKYTFKTEGHVDMILGSPEFDENASGAPVWITVMDQSDGSLVEYDLFVKNRRLDIPLTCNLKSNGITSMLNMYEYLMDKSGRFYFEWVWKERRFMGSGSIDKDSISIDDLEDSTTETEDDSRNHTVVDFKIDLDITYFQIKEVVEASKHKISSIIHPIIMDDKTIQNNEPNVDVNLADFTIPETGTII